MNLPVVKMALVDITFDTTVQIRRRGNSEETIKRYMQAADLMPPPVVYATPEGVNLMSDGFARGEALRRLDYKRIEVELREGTRQEAREYAAVANMLHGEPLSQEERVEAILRLWNRGEGWSVARIARETSLNERSVRNVVDAQKMRMELIRTERAAPRSAPESAAPHSARRASELSVGHLEAVTRAPKEDRVALAQAAAARGWDRDETRLAAQNVKVLPEHEKAALLAGEADPRHLATDSPHMSTVRRNVRAAEAAGDGLRALERALEALAEAEQHGVDACLSRMNGDRARQVAARIPGHVHFLNEVRKAASWQP